MKILVTGGAGFIGSWVVDLLIEEEHSVAIVDNFSTGRKENVHKKARLFETDITDAAAVEHVFAKEKPELVIHMAANALLRKSLEDPLYDARTNILGTISILEACRKNGVKKIIYTSTGGARVGEPEYLPVDEEHPLNPMSPYGISKHSAEHYVWLYDKLYGLEHLILCFGNVYGPRDDPKTTRLVPLFIELVLQGKPPRIFGDGNQTRDFLFVVDLAELIVSCLNKKPEHRLFHLANGEQISVNKIWSLIKKISGTKIEAEHVEAVKGEVRDIVLNISLAQKELGWKPKTDIETGIKETWEWFKGR